MSLNWVAEAYPQIKTAVNAQAAFVASPNPAVGKHARFVLMYLLAHPESVVFGHKECTSLLNPANMADKQSFDPDQEGRLNWWHLHYYCDASPVAPSITGLVGMLAGAPIESAATRQHLVNITAHGSEVSALVTTVNHVTPVRGLMQELGIPHDEATPVYCDSATTLLVASDSKSVKKTSWLFRKVYALREAVVHEHIQPCKVSEAFNLADIFTKYVRYDKWRRHLNRLLNAT